ncbi:capsule assembly Wzi family protein [Tellurirhabdus rosea]|uniref:capsule assembly Wzi family protein n=1 Tax=Tellurirhabdus rosea TaxID=2674997 RepID=UPI00224C9F6F|nr:capsule assembly Wzi family protein [Tellurirhabdus rosea]
MKRFPGKNTPRLLAAGMLLIHSLTATAQSGTAQLTAEAGGLVSSSSRTPFWFRATQFGTVPLTAPRGFARLGVAGTLQTDSTRRTHWQLHYGLDGVANAGGAPKAVLAQSYLSLGTRAVSVRVGRRQEVMGLVDSTLSSGSYAWSANALPPQKIQVQTNGFVTVPFTKGILAVNVLYAHGWLSPTDSNQHVRLHQKAAYGRIGKPGWAVRLYAGVNHQAQWGGRAPYLGKLFANNGQLLSSWQDYLSVIKASESTRRENLAAHDLLNRVGNHLGSIDVGLDANVGRWNIMAYRQHPYEDKSGAAFYNLPDGLYGLRLQSRRFSARKFTLRHVMLEYLHTLDQTGPELNIGSRLYEGRDDYFNNDQYMSGWTNQRRTLGTPFLTPRDEVRPELLTVRGVPRFVVNNRVRALYAGLAGTVFGLPFESRLAYSQNFGQYKGPFRQSVGQFSGALWLTWPVRQLQGLEVRSALAVDRGGLLPAAVSGWLSLRIDGKFFRP